MNCSDTPGSSCKSVHWTVTCCSCSFSRNSRKNSATIWRSSESRTKPTARSIEPRDRCRPDSRRRKLPTGKSYFRIDSTACGGNSKLIRAVRNFSDCRWLIIRNCRRLGRSWICCRSCTNFITTLSTASAVIMTFHGARWEENVIW